MSAEIAKTFLLQNLESVVPLAATFALRAMMSLMLHLSLIHIFAEGAAAEGG